MTLIWFWTIDYRLSTIEQEKMNVTDLPSDLLLYIRKFCCTSHSSQDVSCRDKTGKLIYFRRRETHFQQSWNNFLSMSNSENWKQNRKQIMVWNLDRFSSELFLRQSTFRDYLKERVTIPQRQINCYFFDFRLEPIKYGTLNDAFLPCNIQFLYLDGSDQDIPEELGFPNVRCLHLDNCQTLTRLVGCPNLEALNLSYCPKLSSVN
jgi:hypothetical protein